MHFHFFGLSCCWLRVLFSGQLTINYFQVIKIKVGTLDAYLHILDGFWIQDGGGVRWLGFDSQDKLLFVLLEILVDDISCMHVEAEHTLHACPNLGVEF